MATLAASLSMRARIGVIRGSPTRKLYLAGAGRPSRSPTEAASVVELSCAGLLMRTDAALDVGEPVEIALPETEAKVAIVAWVGEEYSALTFRPALSSANLARIRLKTGRVPRADPEWLDEGEYPHAEATLGQRIKNLRKQCGYTMSHFASRVGVSKPTLWKWEKDMVLPQQKTLKKIASELGITEQTLLYGSYR